MIFDAFERFISDCEAKKEKQVKVDRDATRRTLRKAREAFAAHLEELVKSVCSLQADLPIFALLFQADQPILALFVHAHVHTARVPQATAREKFQDASGCESTRVGGTCACSAKIRGQPQPVAPTQRPR
jgi:hypothetical protein